MSTFMTELSHYYLKISNFEWVEFTMIPASRLSKKGANNNSRFHNIDWVRRLQAQISTVINEWCLQWPQVITFEWVESTMIPVSTFSKSGVNNNLKYSILNQWIQQW